MGKAAAKPKTTTIADDSAQQYMDVLTAKNRFFAATLGMGWRMAITVLVPLVAGIKLDQRFNTSPSLTLAGFMLAVAGAAAVVWNSVKEVNAAQAEADEAAAKKSKKRKTTV
jgi:F0F1-type ATP synthase assembly protein I